MADIQPANIQEFEDGVKLRYPLRQYNSAPGGLGAFTASAGTTLLTGGVERLIIPSYTKAKRVNFKCNIETGFFVGNTVGGATPAAFVMRVHTSSWTLLSGAANGFPTSLQFLNLADQIEFGAKGLRSIQYSNVEVDITLDAVNFQTGAIFSPNLAANCLLSSQLFFEISIKY